MKKTLLFLFALLNGVYAFAQLAATNYRSPVPLSPQASALFKFINVPVDYSRGLVPISIPLYTVKAGDLELPISLDYHSSGIKVHEPSSVVGLGWSLHAEPELSRIVNGLPDEEGFLVNAQLGSTAQAYLYSLTRGFEDEQPDEFAFSLLNSSGKFFYSRKPGTLARSIKTVPYLPVKVDDSNNNYWNLTDDKGNAYAFGRTTNLVEMDNLFKISSWKATQIVNANRTDTISFSYHAKDNDYLMYRTLPVENYLIKDSTSIDYTESVLNQQFYNCSSGWITPYDIEQAKIHITKPSSIPTFSQEYGYDDPQNPITLENPFQTPSTISPLQVEILTINEIRFRGGRVVIEKGEVPNAQEHGKAINRILVYNDLNEIVKEIRFTYQEIISSSYSATTVFNQGRIFLKKLTIVADGKEEVYSFDYDNITSLPYYTSKDVDLWGYYNGPTGNTELMQPTTLHVRRMGGIGVSSVSQNLTLGTANRQPGLAYATAGILTKMSYPTGGSNYFAYELNQATDDMTNQSRSIGGLRISGIYEDGGSNRTFKYGRNENGGGIIKNWIFGNSVNNPFVYEDFRYEEVPLLSYNYSSNCYELSTPLPMTYRSRTLSSQPIFDNAYNGVNAVYPEVTEYFSNNENGKIIYKYAIGSMGNSPYSTPFYINGTTISLDDKKEWMYGHLLSTTIFKGNSTYQPLQHKSSLQLPEIYPDTVWSRKVYPSTRYLHDGYNMDVQTHEFYYTLNDNIQTGYMKLVADTTVEFAPAETATLIRQYNYTNPDLPFPTEEILIASDNSTKKTKRYFPSELTGLGTVYSEMVSRNQLTVPVIEEYSVNGTLKQKNTTTYLHSWDNPYLILPSTLKSQMAGYPEETRIEFIKYDDYGNPLQVRQENVLNTAYLYSYKNRYPIAEIKNMDYASLEGLLGGQALKTFSYSTPTDLQVNSFLSTLRSSLPGSQVSTTTYRPLIGMASNTDPKGMTIYYEYDAFQRLKCIRNQNGDVVKSYCYNYVGQLMDCNVFANPTTYNSAAQSGSFSRTNCGPTGTGGSVTFTIAAHSFNSTISQADADSQALAALATGGPAYANANASCTYFNTIQSGSFSRSNCGPTGTGGSVTYTIAAHSFGSTISQADADNQALAALAAGGPAYANANASCTYFNAVQSSSFSRTNCGPTGTGGSVTYTIAANQYSSTISQADADNQALAALASGGPAYANANASCTYYNAVQSGSFSRTNCGPTGMGGSVTYTIAANSFSSTISQADADSQALAALASGGPAYANTNASCTYYNVAQSGSFSRSNCGPTGTGGSVTYTIAANQYSSNVSQADADSQAQSALASGGPAYANANASCTYYNVAQSGNFTRTNCGPTATGGSVTYTIAANQYSSGLSQADADSQAQSALASGGPGYANANASCTYYSVAQSGSFTRGDCGPTGIPGAVVYSIAAGSYNSSISQADADANALTALNAGGPGYANANAVCTYYNTAQSGNYSKNDCTGSGGPGPSVTYSVNAGLYSSTVSQAAADQLALNNIQANGQSYANINGTCAVPFSIQVSQSSYSVGESVTASFLYSTLPSGTQFEIQLIYPDNTTVGFGPQSRNLFRFTTTQSGQYQILARTIDSSGTSAWLPVYFSVQ